MPINLNTFGMGPTQGMVDLTFHGSVVEGVIDQSINTPVLAGQALKLVPGSSGIPKVVPCTSDNDTVFGFAAYSIKNSFYQNTVNNGALDIAMKDSVMYMTSDGPIAAQAPVQIVNATQRVAARTNGKSVGFAYDAATAAGQLIRVYIEASPTQGATGFPMTGTFTATLAQINAGQVLIPGQAGRQILVSNFSERVNGTFSGGTSVQLTSDATNVPVETTAEAGLTAGAVLVPGSANVTLGNGFAAPLPVGEGLKVASTGTQVGGTSIVFTISYTQI